MVEEFKPVVVVRPPTTLSVPVGQAGDILCAQCQRDGEALAGEEDSRPCALCGGCPADPRHGGRGAR